MHRPRVDINASSPLMSAMTVSVGMVKDELRLHFPFRLLASPLALHFYSQWAPILDLESGIILVSTISMASKKSQLTKSSSYCLIALIKENLFFLGVGVTMEKLENHCFSFLNDFTE